MSEEEDLLQFDGQRDGIEEDINLEDEEEEEPKVFKHLRKEIPEEADVGGQVWYWKTGQGKTLLNLNTLHGWIIQELRGNISKANVNTTKDNTAVLQITENNPSSNGTKPARKHVTFDKNISMSC